MKHIVFVIGYYYPEAGSTSLCAIKVMNDLLKRYDVEISCVCGTNNNGGFEHVNNIDVYKIKHSSFTDSLEHCSGKLERKLLKIKKHLNDFSNIWHYPDLDYRYSVIISKQLEEIEHIKHIDCVVAVYMPKQTISGSLLFLRKHNDIKGVAYYLDTLRSNKPKPLPLKLNNKLINRYENEVFSAFERIILMKYGREYYSQDICERYVRKIFYLGLPSLEMFNLPIKQHTAYGCYYIGTTYFKIRNPLFAMQVFKKANERNKNISLHVFGPSDMKSQLIDWAAEHPNSFYYHDFINHEEIHHIYDEADYVVSIGNQLKGVLPGKTFEIIGTLKPIIHFTDGENDESLQYLRQYPNICIIDYNMSIEHATDILIEFLSKPYRLCDSNMIDSLFKFARPEAVSELIYSTCIK